MTETATVENDRATALRSQQRYRRTVEQRSEGRKEPVYGAVEVGERLGPVTVAVDDRLIKAFAFTQDDYHPWHFGDSPFGRRIGHAAILANHLLDVYYTSYDRFQVAGLHTVEELWFDNPVFAGEEATVTGQYTDKYEHRGRGYVVMDAVAVGEDGRSLMRHHGIEIMRIPQHLRLAERTEAATAPAASEETVTTGVREDLAPATRARADLPAGTAIAPLTKYVTLDQMAVFSLVGEGQRTIHSDLQTAKANGLAEPICQGQQEACYLSELMTRFVGSAWFTGGHLKAKFIRPLPGQVITIAGKVARIEATPSGPRLHAQLWIEGQDGVLTVVGWADSPLDVRGAGQ